MGIKKVKHNASPTSVCHNYSKYRLTNLEEVIDEIGVESLNSEEFYAKYVEARKPVKFTDNLKEIDLRNFRIDKLVHHLGYNGDLKVEKKFKGGFGTNLERVSMRLEELIEKFDSDDGGYYLTTQYDDDEDLHFGESELEGEEKFDEGEENDDEDDDEKDYDADDASDEDKLGKEEIAANDEDDLGSESSFGSIDMNNLHDDFEDSDDEMDESEVRDRIRQLFQPPLSNMYNKLPPTPDLLSSLIPQQVNIWMGYSEPSLTPLNLADLVSKYIPGGGSSSGLHHDHSDNLYILVSGTKRFTLFSPYDADKLATVGSIYKVYNSGVIDYERNENAPTWNHVRDDGAMVKEAALWQLANNDVDPKSKKELLAIINQQHTTYDHKPTNPPSFSNIPPVLLHLDELSASQRQELVDFSNKHFPGFLDTPKLTVWLKPGEMLYLPTGWFHEVSSFGNETVKRNRDKVHIALNYWFVPPNGNSSSKPYRDSYWELDFEKTKMAIDLAIKDNISVE